MNKLIFMCLLIGLTGCEPSHHDQKPTPPPTEQPQPQPQQSPSLGEHLAAAAVTGAAGGAAAGAANAATHHAIESFKKRRRAARIMRSRKR